MTLKNEIQIYVHLSISYFSLQKALLSKKKLFDRSNSLRKIDDDLNSPVYD